ncbi:SLBB domain-containing protein [Massilia agilis]|uniref:SLBB domain-containing protein n=1 Tax=Massilia agilis TaxID=1811226 RepID=A0ABT2D9D0_9BURK|nr:SLBB domain-containing protein [Massilia agilis]MCS0807454.1 SLBB domain-containing protein [Massilia agilis]
MPKIKISFAALALAACAVASAQEKTDFKSDLFGQEATSSVGEVAPGQATHKITITNGSTADSAASTAAAVAQTVANRAPESGTSEFQKFIAENTGQSLPIFGAEFFANAPSTFAPIANAPLPSDYPLGPGDQLLIRGWGTIDIDYRATIDRNGTISLPTIGTIVLAGVKAGDVETVVRNAVAKLYKGVTVNVTFGQLRAITVYVVGQALRPGTYTVSSLSTLVTALFASGGPGANGSMRHVQVKRAGKVAAELDLYSFIAKGDKSADIKLLDGDTIYIPPAGGYVALVGKVNAPAVYELKTGSDTIESLLDVAGGLPVVADPRRAFLERIDAGKSHPRTVEEFALDGQGLKRSLKNGDVLNVTSITPDFANAVVLRGNVDQPVRAPFKMGMRVGDLIPNREYLITRSSVKRQNNVIATGNNEKATNESESSIAGRIGGLLDPINWDYAVIERVNRSDLSVTLIPFNLGNVFSNPSGPDNVQLQPGDTVTIFSQYDVAVPMDKRRVFVRVEGEVKVPGVYQLTAGDTVQTLLAKAGGPTSNAYLFGTEFYREAARREQQANLERAADKLEAQMRREQASGLANARALSGADMAALQTQRQGEMDVARETLSRFRRMKATGRIAFGLEPSERSFARLPQLKLENGDRLVVPARPAFVHVFGAVNVEASPLWRPNARVSDYLKVAGMTPDADTDNVFVMRVDGTVVSAESKGWFFGGIGGLEVMPGDSIVIPQKIDKETRWTKFMQGTREWAQIFANFGLGAAAIKTLRN